MKWKNIAIKFVRPHIAILICLLPISITMLVSSLIHFETTSPISIISYVLAFYTLLIICFRLPEIIGFFKRLKSENKFLKHWFSNVHLRVNTTLYGALIGNVLFATFQIALGFYHKSFWYYSMFFYYVLLGIMRFILVNHTRKFKKNELIKVEIKKYVFCGWTLLLMNLALITIVFFIVYQNKTFNHNMIVTIAIATYTFLSFSFAIVNIFKYKKYKSPVYTATKYISLIGASVSMLTLETTMLTTFGGAEGQAIGKIILPITGVVIIGFALFLSVAMIISGNKHLKSLKENVKKASKN